LLHVGGTGRPASRPPVVVAVDGGPASEAVTSAAVRLARALGAPVELVHVQEMEVVGEDAVDRNDLLRARSMVRDQLAELDRLGVPATGHVLRSVSDHGHVGTLIAQHANAVNAALVAIGSPTHGPFAALIDRSASRRLVADAKCDVLLVRPNGDGAPAGGGTTTSGAGASGGTVPAA
jgi:MFS transporter, ACDE family, multidrug resistance protein